MNYNDLIEKYRNGELDEAQAKEVSRDIEKHEAISDYLAERDDIPELSELGAEAVPDEEAQKAESRAFTKKVRRQIRLAFLKAGIITGAAVLAAVLFCLYALPRIIDKAYYDPTETVGVSEHGMETNRMSMDLSVYTELFQPEEFRQIVSANRLGSGKYTIFIPQNFSVSGDFRDTAGMLDKGKLTLYDPNLLKNPVVNIFDPKSAGLDCNYSNEGIKDSFDPSELSGDRNVVYVTFDSVKNYEELIAWCEQNDVGPFWAAVLTDGMADYPACGFRVYSGSIYQDFEDEKYPCLPLISLSDNRSEETVTQHVSSLFAYAADNYESMCMLAGGSLGELTEQRLRTASERIKENGLQIYGAAMICDRDTAVRLNESDGVVYMWCTNSY